MANKKVVIIGCGFAGLSCLRHLAVLRDRLSVTVIDRKNTSDFLPLLPDIIGRDFPAEILTLDIAALSQHYGCDFLHDEVQSADIARNIVRTKQAELLFDYLVIACGAETNFYGNHDLAREALTFISVQDALRLKEALQSASYENVFVAGGGYTGLEIATHTKRWLRQNSREADVVIIEKMGSILGPVPEWVRAYALRQLEEMNIKVMTGKTVTALAGGRVTLSDGTQTDRSLLVWVAGVKTPRFLDDIPFQKVKGRLVVDPYMRIKDNIFAVGDCAAFLDGGNPLRMAVMFAMGQGRRAARNIQLTEVGKPLQPYRPWDLGYIVPLANNRSSGILLGKQMQGPLVTFLHYGISAFRSYGWRHKLSVMTHALRGWDMAHHQQAP